jgi:hypothetical protein
MAEHARIPRIPFGPDHAPKKDAHADTGQDRDDEQKDDNLHNRLRGIRNHHYRAGLVRGSVYTKPVPRGAAG